MKKILAVLLALALVFALVAMPASAETKSSEWKKGTGPGKLNLTDEGAKISFDMGLQLFYYQKKINIRDFTVKFKVNSPDYTKCPTYVALTIGGEGEFIKAGGGAQAFIVMWIRGTTLTIDPQILHSGKADIRPASKDLGIDFANQDITIHCKQVDELTYSLDFNDGALYYEFGIPENFNFVEDLNGEGCIAFGGSTGEAVEAYEFGQVNVLVKEINGVKMNGKDDPVSSNNGGSTGGTTGGTTGGSTGGSTDAGNTDGIIGGVIGADPDTDSTDVVTEEKDNTLLIVIIICVSVLLLAVIVMVIVIVLKKKPVALEEVSEDETEETTEE